MDYLRNGCIDAQRRECRAVSFVLDSLVANHRSVIEAVWIVQWLIQVMVQKALSVHWDGLYWLSSRYPNIGYDGVN